MTSKTYLKISKSATDLSLRHCCSFSQMTDSFAQHEISGHGREVLNKQIRAFSILGLVISFWFRYFTKRNLTTLPVTNINRTKLKWWFPNQTLFWFSFGSLQLNPNLIWNAPRLVIWLWELFLLSFRMESSWIMRQVNDKKRSWNLCTYLAFFVK